jgi:hypothetical protein
MDTGTRVMEVVELGGNPRRLRDSISLRFAAAIKWLKRPPTTLPWRTKARFRQEDSSAPTLEPWTIVVMPFSTLYEDANETIGLVNLCITGSPKQALISSSQEQPSNIGRQFGGGRASRKTIT